MSGVFRPGPDEDDEGGYTDDFVQLIDIATGTRLQRRSAGAVGTFCAPAGVGTVWCSSRRDVRTIELRDAVTGRRILGESDIRDAHRGRIDDGYFWEGNLRVTRNRHELVLRADSDEPVYAIDPETFDARVIDLDAEQTIIQTRFGSWTTGRIEVGDAVYEIGDIGARGLLLRRPADDPDAEPEVLDPERRYRNGGFLRESPFGEPRAPLRADDPPSVFVTAPSDSGRSVSRVRLEDGEPLYTVVGRPGGSTRRPWSTGP